MGTIRGGGLGGEGGSRQYSRQICFFPSYFSSNPPPRANTPTAAPEASTATAASAWGSP